MFLILPDKPDSVPTKVSRSKLIYHCDCYKLDVCMLLVSILKNMWFKVSLVILLYFYCVSLALKPRLRDIMPRRKATPGYRLPKNVQILNQQVTLEPSLDTFSFTGTTTINGVFLTNTTDQIILHSKDLIITNYTIEIDASVITNEVTLSFDVEKEFIILALTRFQNEGAHFRLNFTFSGILNDDRRGFYRASYLDEYGERRYIKNCSNFHFLLLFYLLFYNYFII